jgi:hypothetical protein
MMRKPTSVDAQLAWWRLAIRSEATMTEHIECGYFKKRERARSQTWLPVRITLHQPMDWETGELTGPEIYRLEVAGGLIQDQDRIWDEWLRLRPVSLQEWRWLTARLSLHQGLNGTDQQLYASAFF